MSTIAINEFGQKTKYINTEKPNERAKYQKREWDKFNNRWVYTYSKEKGKVIKRRPTLIEKALKWWCRLTASEKLAYILLGIVFISAIRWFQ